jgi:hypothetical protein
LFNSSVLRECVCSEETDSPICKEPAALFEACCAKQQALAKSEGVTLQHPEGKRELPSLEDPDYVSSSLTTKSFERYKRAVAGVAGKV